MRQDRKIECCEEENVNAHIWVAHCRLGNIEHSRCHSVAQVVVRPEVASVQVSAVSEGLVEVQAFVCASSMSADVLLCHFGKEGNRQCGFRKAYPGDFPSQSSTFYAQDTQCPTSSLLRHRGEVSSFGTVLALLWRAKILLWLFCSHSRQGSCRTVLAVPDLLAMPL